MKRSQKEKFLGLGSKDLIGGREGDHLKRHLVGEVTASSCREEKMVSKKKEKKAWSQNVAS